jgi:hypothetical protein
MVRQKQYETAKGDQRLDAAQVYAVDLLTVADAMIRAGNFDEALKRSRQVQAVLSSLRLPLPEWVAPMAKRAAELTKNLNRAVTLTGQLKSETPPKGARDELVRLLALDLDSPQEAVKYLDATSDPLLAKYVPALLRKIDEAPGNQVVGAARGPVGLLHIRHERAQVHRPGRRPRHVNRLFQRPTPHAHGQGRAAGEVRRGHRPDQARAQDQTHCRLTAGPFV